jgi:hypothetical protein
MGGRRLSGLGVLLLAALSLGCNGTMGAIIGGTIGVTLAGARSPSHEIEQIYYLGVFDPREQLPEAIYRITVKGQASIISFTRFASGWVPAAVIDSLGGKVKLAATTDPNDLTISAAHADSVSQLNTGRRLVLFGPEGFREAPRDHRLVIVMGSSPEEFFRAIDTTLGTFAEVQLERDNADLQRALMTAMIQLRDDQRVFKDIELETVKEIR